MKLVLGWSGGKDSAWALHRLRANDGIEVVGLFTTCDPATGRVPLQGIRTDIVEVQAERAHLPVELLPLRQPASNRRYETVMRRYFRSVSARGVDAVAWGDLFLADIREYREKLLEGTGLEAVFPLWQAPTAGLAAAMLESGLDALVSSVDLARLPATLAGRRYNADLLETLPAGVDPCGENGEFHTLVRGGPMFTAPVKVSAGEHYESEGFAYADFEPVADVQ